MEAISSVQSSSSKHFLHGFIIGIGAAIIIEIINELFFIFSSATFGVSFTDNVDTVSLVSQFIKYTIFVILLALLQKKFKNKFTTTGAACGFVATVVILSVMVTQFFK